MARIISPSTSSLVDFSAMDIPIDTAAAIKRIIIITSLNCARNLIIQLFFLASPSEFDPFFS